MGMGNENLIPNFWEWEWECKTAFSMQVGNKKGISFPRKCWEWEFLLMPALKKHFKPKTEMEKTVTKK